MNKSAKWLLGASVAIAVIVSASLVVFTSPESKAKTQARAKIELCRDEVKRFTGAAVHRNMMNASCEKLVNDFSVLYGEKP